MRAPFGLVAINRQLTHYADHVGQIVLPVKHARVAEWNIERRPWPVRAIQRADAEDVREVR